MDFEYKEQLLQWIETLGLSNVSSGFMNVLWVVLIVGVSYVAVRFFVIRVVHALILRSQSKFDDMLIQYNVLERASVLVPLLLFDVMLPLLFSEGTFELDFFGSVFSALITIQFVRILFSLLDVAQAIADQRGLDQKMPVKSMIQMVKLFLFFMLMIVVVSVLSGRSPWYLLSGLGVATGLVMLVFRDTILGFIAGIQLSANRMVSQGDWIEMSNYGADGSVEEVSLTTVKVRNWDHTISMIPAYALVSDSFRNWRGMTEAGGRRIKRAIYLDITSIHFLSESELEKVKELPLLKKYMEEKKLEFDDLSKTLGEHQFTNSGVFRAYVLAYLKSHPVVRQDMTLLVRQLAATEYGLPLELYVFGSDTRWSNYEDLQSDIFDHLYALLPEFGLKAYQRPISGEFSS